MVAASLAEPLRRSDWRGYHASRGRGSGGPDRQGVLGREEPVREEGGGRGEAGRMAGGS